MMRPVLGFLRLTKVTRSRFGIRSITVSGNGLIGSSGGWYRQISYVQCFAIPGPRGGIDGGPTYRFMGLVYAVQ